MAARPGPRRRFSPLTRRILFLNMVPLLLLAASVLYLDDFRRGLIAAEMESLTTQGRIIAAALGEAAVSIAESDDEEADDRLAPDASRQVLRRLVEPARLRARLYDYDGTMLADTRSLGSGSFSVDIDILLPPGAPPNVLQHALDAAIDLLTGGIGPAELDLPLYRERAHTSARDYEEAVAALGGETGSAIRRDGGGHLSISVAVPVQRFRQVLGALQLTSDGLNVENSLRAVRRDILHLTAGVLAITVLISLYLAGTIARPIRRLARAAERVRLGGRTSIGGQGIGGTLGAGLALATAIPDLSKRGDEIGDLSASLRAMTEALARRLDSIDRFAADVAHELKNPLTSLKSAVETAARVPDPAVREKLMAIVLDDVQRLDRLITDISGASRLDAELSRADAETLDVAALLEGLCDALAAVAKEGQAKPVYDGPAGGGLFVSGVADRLTQVFRNVIGNAQSFSPPGADIRVSVARDRAWIVVRIDDEGPGIPEDKLEAIFDRFYSERPANEKFGTHSGLGLSISRQIIEAHGGTIAASNRLEQQGARFTIKLPVA
ncbi:MAG: stimulus-sensing domain-containing protein [Alphaproteobacteria bacterium]|nr:stimulus-sensing domain-containing protein [Alphaproteobacteria bacterium]